MDFGHIVGRLPFVGEEKRNLFSLCAAVCMSVFALTGAFASDTSNMAIVVAACFGWGLMLYYRRDLFSSCIVFLFALAMVSQYGAWQWSVIDDLPIVEDAPKFNRMTGWFYCFPVAYLLAGTRRNCDFLFGLFVFGLFAAIWISGNGWHEILRGLSGLRVDFGIHNAQHTSMLFGLALIFLFSKVVDVFSIQGGLKFLARGLWLSMIVGCLIILVITQTRGVWLGLIAALLIGIILAALKRRLTFRLGCWISRLCWGGGLLLALWLCHEVGAIFQDRTAYTINQIAVCQVDAAQPECSESIGARLAMWQESIAWIEARPIWGWGGQGRKMVIESAPQIKSSHQFGHLHNSYVDLMIGYGMVGMAVLLGLLIFLFYGAFYAWRRSVISLSEFIFYWSFLGYWLAINIFESYMFFSSGVLAFTMVSGVILTRYWRAQGKI